LIDVTKVSVADGRPPRSVIVVVERADADAETATVARSAADSAKDSLRLISVPQGS